MHMEMETIAAMKENNGQEVFPPSRPKFGRRLSSSCETPRAKNTKQFTFDEVPSPPSLEASLDCSSASFAADERRESSSRSLKASQQTTESPPSPTDEGCMTDRMVRFFCPFDAIQEASPPASTRKQKTRTSGSNPHNMENSPYAAMCTPNQDCSGDWLKTPVQICMPEQWDSSPERSSLDGKGLNIRNRCSTLDAKERKSEYIHQIRKQWHSRTDPVPLRSSRSEAVAKHQRRPPVSIQVPAAYYDSDPEVAPSTPSRTSRYKRNRPTSLNLDLKTDMDTNTSNFACPRVLRHSSQEFHSFFESPRSVVETPDFNDDSAVREFIQVGNTLFSNAQEVAKYNPTLTYFLLSFSGCHRTKSQLGLASGPQQPRGWQTQVAVAVAVAVSATALSTNVHHWMVRVWVST